MSWPLVPTWLEEFTLTTYVPRMATLPPIIDRDPGDETEYDNQRG